MAPRTLLVVGDKFSQFAEDKDVLTLSKLRHLLNQDQPAFPGIERVTLVPGQGLGDKAVKDILDEAAKSKSARNLDFSLWRNRPERAKCYQSHKRKPENILVSQPKCLCENVFLMDLMVDDGSDLMSDHQSGQHIQGMILLEAARQSLLVVTETFFLPKEDIQYGFVFNKIDVTYQNFAFPFDAQLRYEIKQKNTRKPTRMNFIVHVSIVQCGVVAAVFKMDFTAFKKEVISCREGALANTALVDHLKKMLASSEEEGVLANA